MLNSTKLVQHERLKSTNQYCSGTVTFAKSSPVCSPVQLTLQSCPIQKDIVEDVVIHLAELKILLRIFLTYQPKNPMFF